MACLQESLIIQWSQNRTACSAIIDTLKLAYLGKEDHFIKQRDEICKAIRTGYNENDCWTMSQSEDVYNKTNKSAAEMKISNARMVIIARCARHYRELQKALFPKANLIAVENDQEKENEKQVDEIELATPGLQSLQEEVICKDKLIASQNIEIADWRARFELLETEKMRLQTNQSRLSKRIVSLLWEISEHGQNDMTPQHSNSLQNVNKRTTLQK